MATHITGSWNSNEAPKLAPLWGSIMLAIRKHAKYQLFSKPLPRQAVTDLITFYRVGKKLFAFITYIRTAILPFSLSGFRKRPLNFLTLNKYKPFHRHSAATPFI